MATSKRKMIQELRARVTTGAKPLLIQVPTWSLAAVDELPDGVTEANGTVWVKEGDAVVGVSASISVPGFRPATRDEAEAHARQLLAEQQAVAPGSKATPEAVGPAEYTLAARAAVARARGEERAWSPCLRCGHSAEHAAGEKPFHPGCRP